MVVKTTVSDQLSAAIAHQANIDRYRRILETELTIGERRFIKRCIAEEDAALEKLSSINS